MRVQNINIGSPIFYRTGPFVGCRKTVLFGGYTIDLRGIGDISFVDRGIIKTYMITSCAGNSFYSNKYLINPANYSSLEAIYSAKFNYDNKIYIKYISVDLILEFILR